MEVRTNIHLSAVREHLAAALATEQSEATTGYVLTATDEHTVTVTIGERRKTPGPFGRVDATAGSDPAVMLDDLETELARRWLVMRPDAATLIVCEPSIYLTVADEAEAAGAHEIEMGR